MSYILVVGPTPAVQRRITLGALRHNEVNRALEVEVLASGKGINCARAVKRLGAHAETLLLLGGAPGAWIRAELRREHIPLHTVETACPTRTCCTIVEKGSGGVTEIVEKAGEVCAGTETEMLSQVDLLARKAAVIVCIGTLPLGLGVGFYADIAERAAHHGIPVIVDAQGQHLVAALPCRPFLVKPNRYEIGAATGMDTSTEEGLFQAVARLHELGAQNVVVTDGPRGVFFSDGNSMSVFQPPCVHARNPIGSGDSLAAGIAVGLARGGSIRDAVLHGIACGVANAMGDGYGRIDPATVTSCLPCIKPV